MRRDSSSKRLLSWLTAVALGIAAPSVMQAAQPEAEAAATPAPAAESDEAPAAESPRRARERRRNEEAAQDTAGTQAAAAAAPATPDTGAAATLAEQPAETVEARLVCKSYKRTGTRMARRVCGTPEQWAALDEATTDNAQEGMRQIRDRSTIAMPSDNPLNPND